MGLVVERVGHVVSRRLMVGRGLAADVRYREMPEERRAGGCMPPARLLSITST